MTINPCLFYTTNYENDNTTIIHMRASNPTLFNLSPLRTQLQYVPDFLTKIFTRSPWIKLDITSLNTQKLAYQNHISELIKKAKTNANILGKPLLILAGNEHRDTFGLLPRLTLFETAKANDIKQFHVEMAPRYQTKAEEGQINNNPLNLSYFFICRYLGIRPNAIDLDNDHNSEEYLNFVYSKVGIIERDNNFSNKITEISPNQDAIFEVGSLHIKGLTERLSDRYYIVSCPINYFEHEKYPSYAEEEHKFLFENRSNNIFHIRTKLNIHPALSPSVWEIMLYTLGEKAQEFLELAQRVNKFSELDQEELNIIIRNQEKSPIFPDRLTLTQTGTIYR